MNDIAYFYPDGHERHFETGHPERPERVETIQAALRGDNLWEQFPKLPPIVVPKEILNTVHSPDYLNLLEMTCRRSGRLDMDTYTTRDSWSLALQAAGGAAGIAEAVWDGRAQRGFALTRPPGHHAMHGQGMGFCLLNNIAIAAEYLIQRFGIQHAAIVDLDLHHGNGTQDIFWKRDEVFYISTHQSPFYPGTGRVDDIGEGAGERWTANLPLPPGSGDTAFMTIMDELILPLLQRKMPQILLVSYGFDPHWLDPLGQLLLTADGYAKIIGRLCDWADKNCNGKIALFLEGGYDLQAAEACSLAVTRVLLGLPWDDLLHCPFRDSNAWQPMLQRAKSIWEL
jgi:acetoin utilization deacetylase AcuC-like enzyme